jgi:methyl-accepting chemotaxis protein
LNAERRAREAERLEQAQSLQAATSALGEALRRLSEGDVAYRIETSFAGDLESLRIDYNNSMLKLQSTLNAVNASSTAIRTGSEEIRVAADDMSNRTEEQAASLEQTVAALDQITSTVRQTADGAVRAREIVVTAQRDADASGEVVQRTMEAMQGISDSAQKITQIIGVIDEIAFQTNLLALNAGVEAARAGEAGRGFAVVASEVRALAQRSAEAAKEIKSLITMSTTQVNAGVDLVGEAAQTLERIMLRVGEISGVVLQISSAAQEQATSLQEVSTAMSQMDQTTQQNAAMVEQSTAATHSLSQEVDQLANLLAQFRLGDSGWSSRQARSSQTPRLRSVPRQVYGN